MGSQSSSEVRKRIAERRKNRERLIAVGGKRDERPVWPEVEEEKEWGTENVFVYEEGITKHTKPPIIKKEWIVFRILASVCLVLVIAIIYRTSAPWTQTAKLVLDTVYQQEFQFAAVSNWFEDTIGKPFAFLPEDSITGTDQAASDSQFATPATGTIMQSFVKDGQGVLIKTSNSTSVDTIKEGVVIYAGEKESHGKTVIVQHPDKSESWYAHLQEINVSLYEEIKKGTKVGKVSPSDEGDKGEFYFALKANGKFIDPNEVISFE